MPSSGIKRASCIVLRVVPVSGGGVGCQSVTRHVPSKKKEGHRRRKQAKTTPFMNNDCIIVLHLSNKAPEDHRHPSRDSVIVIAEISAIFPLFWL
jgi:hypothetical protein